MNPVVLMNKLGALWVAEQTDVDIVTLTQGIVTIDFDGCEPEKAISWICKSFQLEVIGEL